MSDHQANPTEPFGFGDVVRLQPARGRIGPHRTIALLLSADKVFGAEDEYRYDTLFFGDPIVRGKCYSTDVIQHLRTLPEVECCDLLQRERQGAAALPPHLTP